MYMFFLLLYIVKIRLLFRCFDYLGWVDVLHESKKRSCVLCWCFIHVKWMVCTPWLYFSAVLLLHRFLMLHVCYT